MHAINAHFLFFKISTAFDAMPWKLQHENELKKKGGHLLIRYLFHNQFWGSHSYWDSFGFKTIENFLIVNISAEREWKGQLKLHEWNYVYD